MNKKFIFTLTFIFFFISSKFSFAANDEDIYDKIDLFGEVLDKIKKDYVEEVNQKYALDAAINGVSPFSILL